MALSSIALLSFLVSCQVQPQPKNLDMSRIALISSRMQSFIAAQRIPGVVTLVAQDGIVLHRSALGFADIKEQSVMRDDTIFQIMSITKPITAMAIMLLVDEGKVNLSDPIDRFLPKFAKMSVLVKEGASENLVPMARKIQVRHLLTHMSGLSSSDPAPLTDDAKRKLTLADLVDRIAAAPLSYQPGTRVSYSGVGTSVAGRIVEIASGMTFERFLETRLFQPLDLQDTTFFLPREKRTRLANVYMNENASLKVHSEDRFREGARLANPAGGLYSTARDIFRLMQLMLNRGKFNDRQIISDRSVKAMTQVQSTYPPPEGSDSTSYGYGWAITVGPSLPSNLMSPGSFGHSGAYGTYCWADPSTGLIGIFLTQVVGGDTVVLDTFRTLVNASIQQ